MLWHSVAPTSLGEEMRQIAWATAWEPRSGFEQWIEAHVKGLGTDGEQRAELYREQQELYRARLARIYGKRGGRCKK